MKYDPLDPVVGRYEYVVRDVEEPDLGIQRWEPPTPSLKSRGSGDLKARASQEIQERLALEEHVGEHVATVTIDVNAWEFDIHWEVEPPLRQRFVDGFNGLLDALAEEA